MSPVQNSPPPETINEDEILTVTSETRLQPRKSTSSAALGSLPLVQRSKSVNSYHSIAICQDYQENNNHNNSNSINNNNFGSIQKENIYTNLRQYRQNLNYSITSSDSESALNKKLSLVISNSDLENTECLTYEMVQRRLKRNKRQRIPSHCEVVSQKSVGSGSGTNLNEGVTFSVGSSLSKLSLTEKQNHNNNNMNAAKNKNRPSSINTKTTKFSFPEPNQSSDLPQLSTSRTSPNTFRSISPAQHLARSRENLNQSLNFHHLNNNLKNCMVQNPQKTAPLLESISISEISDTGSGCLADISTNDISVSNITETSNSNGNGNEPNLMVNRIYSNSNFILQKPTPVLANFQQNSCQAGQNPSGSLRDSGLNSEISGAFSCGNGNNGSPRVFSIGGIKKDRCVSPLRVDW